jgi:signal peptidase II
MSTEAETATDARPALGPRLPRLFVVAAACVVVLDQITKLIAVEYLAANPIDLGIVRLVLIRNPNAAFGIPGFPGLFLLVTVVVTALVVRSLPRTPSSWVTAAYGLVIGGAIGNAIDRVFRAPGFPAGAVVDWIYPGWFPAFNVADSSITVGASLLVLLLARAEAAERDDGG